MTDVVPAADRTVTCSIATLKAKALELRTFEMLNVLW